MAEIGEQGKSFNFSSATRSANFRPDIDRIKQHDPYRQKYVRITRIVQGVGLLTAGFAVRLWTTGNGVWAVVVGILALLLLAVGYMIGRGANASIYESGLLIPGRIVALNPLQLVVMADMNNSVDDDDEHNVDHKDADEAENADNPNTADKTDNTEEAAIKNGNDLYGVRRVTLKDLPVHTLQIGERVPCAAGFGGSNLGGWGHFEPRPLVWATDDLTIITAAAAAIPDEEWARLDRLASELPQIEEEQVAFYDAELRFIEAK